MPIVHLIAGPNGSGKTTFHDRILAPAMHLPFINADLIARVMWPGDEETHGHDASRLAEQQRDQMLVAGRSFIAETVFSHPSKLDFMRRARAAGYLVILHVILVPEALSVQRTQLRADQGGHTVPEDKVRSRYRRLWPLVQQAFTIANEAIVYDNSLAARPYREVAHFHGGVADYPSRWPDWSPLR